MTDRPASIRPSAPLPRAVRRLGRLLACAFCLLLARAAGAQPRPPVRTPPWLGVEAQPIFGSSSLVAGGWAEILVRIANNGKEQLRGRVDVLASGAPSAQEKGRTRAAYAVSAGETVSLRIPIRIGENDDPLLVISDESGRPLLEQPFVRTMDSRTLLVEVQPVSALGSALRDMPLAARYDAWVSPHHGGYYAHSTSRVDVVSPPWDPATGEPVLPARTAGYTRVAAVLIPSAVLLGLDDVSLRALAGYVLAGGTLALTISRPEDRRHPAIVKLTGGELSAGEPSSAAVAELSLLKPPSLPGAPGSSASGGRPLPVASAPEPELAKLLTGYRGGNLRPSAYGSSAAYGLGEVHVLSFDPSQKPGVDSAWAHIRVLDLLRRASERRSSVLFHPGDVHEVTDKVRRELDPNEGARWAIMLAALLLCLYAVLAGPINFAQFRKRGRPLQSLVVLPILAAGAFALVVIIGVFAKGCTGRSRHLTLVEAGAGMKVGTARRWRGFFVPRAREITVPAQDITAVLGSERDSFDDELRDQLEVDRTGVRLTQLGLRPWETAVIREDSLASLGEGVALIKLPGGETKIENRTGHKLRGLLLCQPGEPRLLFAESLPDGGSLTSGSPQMEPVTGSLSTRPASWGLPLRELDVFAVERQLERSATGLGAAWEAVADGLRSRSADWFPADVPTLLAQVEGGEGRSSDSGLQVDSDRLLIRIVGYGGEP